MAEEKKITRNPSKPRHGKSMGLCTKCGVTYNLKHHTKHNHTKIIKGICPTCGGRSNDKPPEQVAQEETD
jgi:predicted  nucleic acid-binding Zn-ribbon protein